MLTQQEQLLEDKDLDRDSLFSCGTDRRPHRNHQRGDFRAHRKCEYGNVATFDRPSRIRIAQINLKWETRSQQALAMGLPQKGGGQKKET